MYLLEERVTCMVANTTPLLRNITLRVWTVRAGKTSIDLEDTSELGNIAEPNPPLLQQSSSSQSYLQVMSS